MAEGTMEKFIKSLSEKTGANSQKNEGDYYDNEGLLRCGVCGEKKETIVTLPGGKKMKVHCVCSCIRKKEEEQKRAEENRQQMERLKRLRQASLIDENFSNASFSNFKLNGFNETNLKLCQRYCSAFSKMLAKPQGLLFWGEVGTGKSFAAACIANELLDHGTPVVMTSFVKILEMIQGNKDKEAEMMHQVENVKLLIIDDLGAERNTEYAVEKVYNIIDSRYRAKLPMILTTNLNLKDMMEEPDLGYRRIYDRILEVCYPMQFTGKSWRRAMAKDRFDEMAKMFE